MIMRIDHIDRIARLKRHDVLLLEFENVKNSQRRSDWQTHPSRKNIVRWLDAQKIPWRPCGPMANLSRLTAYNGEIYIDLPYDPKEKRCRLLEEFMALPGDAPRWPGAKLWLVPLEVAKANAHHDKPGFWDEWAETF